MCNRLEPEAPGEILQRLNRLEDVVRQQTDVITKLSDRLSSTSSNNGPRSVPASQVHGQSISNTSPAPSPFIVGEVSTSVDMSYGNNEDGPFLMPLGHQTPTSSLLMLDRTKALIGEYQQGFILSQESGRRLPPLIPRKSFSSILERLAVRYETAEFLVAKFCIHILSQFPIMDRDEFLDMFSAFLKTSQGNTVSDALCLMALALGEVCSTTIDVFNAESPNGMNGNEYFAHASQILAANGSALFSKDPTAALTYFFFSVYFRYKLRPLEAWKHIHTASTGIQVMFKRYCFSVPWTDHW